MSEGLEVKFLQSLLSSERSLREAAEAQLTEWRGMVERLAAMMDSAALDDAVTSESLPSSVEEWERFLRGLYARRVSVWEASEDCAGELQAALDQVSALEEENASLRTENASLKDAMASRPNAAAAGLQARPPESPIQGSPPASQPGGEGASRLPGSASRPVPAAPASGPPLRDSRPVSGRREPNLSAFRRFIPPSGVAESMASRATVAILVLGETGFSLRVQMLTEVGRRLNPDDPVNPDTGSMKRMVQRLEAWGLARQRVIVGDWARLAVVELTEKGRSAYRAMTGEQPVESDLSRLRRLHSGDEQAKHTAFVLGAAFHLWRRGLDVRPVPTDFPSPFEPDLAFLEDGRWWGVECERWHPDRDRGPKWRNASLAQGRVYIIGTDEVKSKALAEEALKSAAEVYYTDMLSLSQRDDGEWAWKRARKSGRRR